MLSSREWRQRTQRVVARDVFASMLVPAYARAMRCPVLTSREELNDALSRDSAMPCAELATTSHESELVHAAIRVWY
eukprot:288197-Rhodomonas_salina.1